MNSLLKMLSLTNLRNAQRNDKLVSYGSGAWRESWTGDMASHMGMVTMCRAETYGDSVS